MENKIITKLKLDEFFMFEVETIVGQVNNFLRSELEDVKVEELRSKFTKRGWFNKDHYTLM
jgi:hypothetical protein